MKLLFTLFDTSVIVSDFAVNYLKIPVYMKFIFCVFFILSLPLQIYTIYEKLFFIVVYNFILIEK